MSSKTLGILAHVDAGKTTLTEAMLYTAGAIRKLGRVDHKDTFLDTNELEKLRGITIFSKQAIFDMGENRYFMLDTPGHVDFSTEMERSLLVMDYAVLVISAVEKVQGHTETVWKMLEKYNVPTFLFINKIDREDIDLKELDKQLKTKLSDRCVDFSDRESLLEDIVSVDEELMEKFFEGDLDKNTWIKLIKDKIADRKLFPCFFGSALQNSGVKRFLKAIDVLTYDSILKEKLDYMRENNDDLIDNEKTEGIKIHREIKDHKGIVFKVLHDEQKNRLVFIRVVNKKFVVKDIIGDEKINQIRIYNGSKYQAVSEAIEGELCAVTGLSNVNVGDCIIDGKIYKSSTDYMIVPILTSKVFINGDIEPKFVLDVMKILEDEDPLLDVKWNEVLKEIHISIMGKIQLEILKDEVAKRFGYDIDFGKCEIVYKETIDKAVMGYGHFEPLRHYSEAHIRLEPAKCGSGIKVLSECKLDIIDKNHQNVIMHSLEVKEHKGILTGFSLTDVNMILVKGKTHIKHTEGGDFYEASCRAVRQALEKLGKEHNVLLEPFYEFELNVPIDYIGRAMSDIQKMYGEFDDPIIYGDTAKIKGIGPVVTFMEYPMDVISYTKGKGKVFFKFFGYRKCHNTDEVIDMIGYEKDRDRENPSYSVFCSHGAGFNVMWNEVENYAHLELTDLDN